MTDTSTVRAAVTAAITAITGAGWTVSRFSPDQFGKDTDRIMHHAFVVAIPESTPHARDGRQRVSEGLLVESTVDVSWAHRLRGDAQAADYDAMLDAEQSIVGAIRAISDAHVLIVGMSRRAGPEGFILGSVRAKILHRYALA